MSIIQGTITQASQLGQPDSRGNYYQDIAIATPDGQTINGRIGSKSGYAQGAQIAVTIEQKTNQNGPYNYFHKYNPQQQGQQGYQQPQYQQQQASPAPPLGAQAPVIGPPASPVNQQKLQQVINPPRDFQKENSGKCRFGLYCSTIEGCGMKPSELVKNVVELGAIEELVFYSMNGLATDAPKVPTQQQYDETGPPPTDSDIQY